MKNKVNVILTFDSEIGTGNIKLYVDGKLEDQSGILDVDGEGSTSNVSNTYPYLRYESGSKLVIGAYTTNHSSYTLKFDGIIEEVCIYKDVIYPLVPSTGEITITKAMSELSSSSKATGKPIVARLSIFDYHNIRGTSARDVAISAPVSFRKSGLGLETNNARA